MYLKSITVKGFKSFPDRTLLEFGPGVSVVVGPNGSGKSNITDAVLWALGEQSPLAVRGSSMQDVIFGGGRGVQARQEASVELVLDNGDGTLDLPLSELSIVRRLNRSGEGEYRLNGARCRLIDVLEVLSDTGLGKEMHSVISQGRVEAIVTSKARDRRLLIEEAAGLGKHRKRRRRAQLKLERTQENLDRALDVEREARARLRPLKRQAEAAELHERLERQSLEARWTLARDAARLVAERLAEAERRALEVRAAREEVESKLALVAAGREQAEEALARRAREHDELARRAVGARAARDRIALRVEQIDALAARLAERGGRRTAELAPLRAAAPAADPVAGGRIVELEAALAELDAEREELLGGELAKLEAECAAAVAASAEAQRGLDAVRQAATRCEAEADAARGACREAERALEAARREAARVGAELATTNHFLRSTGLSADAPALAGALDIEPGCELALAAVLGERLGAAIAGDRAGAVALLDGTGDDGGSVLVAGAGPPASAGAPPSADAEPLAGKLRGQDEAAALARRLLAGVWLVGSLDDVPEAFPGVAVTRAGRAWIGPAGELRQAARGGRERVLEQRNHRETLLAATASAAQAQQDAAGASEAAAGELARALEAREASDATLRAAERALAETRERERRAAWLIEQRRAAPEQGVAAVRRAELAGELAAERRAAERVEQERAARAARIERLECEEQLDAALVPRVVRLQAALALAAQAIAVHAAGFEQALEAAGAAGEGVAAELRACAAAEAELQALLREQAERVTQAEVAAQQARDAAAEAETELGALAARLELDATPAAEPLEPAEAQALRDRVERLARRREQLGPVNPLAADEYREACEQLEEFERQRADLETALRELRALIRDTDRQIAASFEETFAAAARNFEELVEDVFPGGSGRLRLVDEEAGPRAVLGGQPLADGAPGGDGEEAAADAEEAAREFGPDDLGGVEIEVTPAGKSTKRLSLLSGGEKAMTAIAFLFAVFLARPCPFYVLDEVEAALDDLNIDRFLALLRRYSGRAEFIVVTHQKRTMEAADCLYGVSMGGDGVSKVASRRLPREDASPLVRAGLAG